MVRRVFVPLAILVAVGPAFTSKVRASAPDTEVWQTRLNRASFIVNQKHDGRVTIAWAFRVEDLLSCSNSAMTLRHVKARFGDRVELVAVAVGEDPGIVDSFMRRQRLAPQIVRMSKEEYEQAYTSDPLPSMHLITDGHIRNTAVDSTWVDGPTRRERPLEVAVGELLAGTTSGVEYAAFTLMRER